MTEYDDDWKNAPRESLSTATTFASRVDEEPSTNRVDVVSANDEGDKDEDEEDNDDVYNDVYNDVNDDDVSLTDDDCAPILALEEDNVRSFEYE